MEYRKLVESDGEELWELYTEAVGASQYFGSKWSKLQFFDEITNSIGVGIKKENLWVALLIVKQFDEAEIMWLGVRKPHRRQGLMTQLLDFYKATFDLMGKPLILEVHEKNILAYNFYKDYGFKELRRRSNYYYDGADALVMSLSMNTQND